MKYEEWKRRKGLKKRQVNLRVTAPRLATEQEVESELKGFFGDLLKRATRKEKRRRGTFGPVKKAAPPRVVTLRELEFRKRDTRQHRAKRHRAASLGQS